MKKYFYSVLLLSLLGVFIYSFSETKASRNSIQTNTSSKSFFDLKIQSLDGTKTLLMSDLKGKKILCVNVASECGYTPQYEGLQKLQDTYKDKLVIIGFPCNQFGGQEPGDKDQIATFCKKNYGVTFLLTEKIDVKGDKQHAIYQWLTQKSLNGMNDATVKWNFNKFLIDEAGNWVAYFPSNVDPMSTEITSKIK